MTENEMLGRHHWLNGHEFEQAPGVGDGQGSLACCSPWGRMTGLLNWTELNFLSAIHAPTTGTVCVCVCVCVCDMCHLLFLRVKRWIDNFRQCDTIFSSVEELEDTALPENLEWLFLRGHGEWFLEVGSPSALGTDEPRKETSCYKNTARQCDEHFYLQI